MDVLNTSIATTTFNQRVIVVISCVPAKATVFSCIRIVFVLLLSNRFWLLLFTTFLIWLLICHFQINIFLTHLFKLLLSIAYYQISLFVVLVCAAVIRQLSEIQINWKYNFLLLLLLLLVIYLWDRHLLFRFWLRKVYYFVFCIVIVKALLLVRLR